MMVMMVPKSIDNPQPFRVGQLQIGQVIEEHDRWLAAAQEEEAETILFVSRKRWRFFWVKTGPRQILLVGSRHLPDCTNCTIFP